MKSIDHLPEEEKKHYIFCEKCGEYVDMRDLSDVFYHESGDCVSDKPKKDIPFSSSKRRGDPEEHLKNKGKIDLN